jgi:glutathione S-transferase
MHTTESHFSAGRGKIMSNPHLTLVSPDTVLRKVTPRRPRNADLRTREHLTPDEVDRLIAAMDHELDGDEFIASDRFTIADITAVVAIDFGGRLAVFQIAPSVAHLTCWHETVSKRPSAKV